MTTLGLPPEMFWIFVATVLAGSLGAIHYVVAHIILGRPFAEIPPPVLREGGLPEPGGGPAGEPGPGSEGSGEPGGSGPGSEGSGASGGSGPGSEGSGASGGSGPGSEGPGGGRRRDGEHTDG